MGIHFFDSSALHVLPINPMCNLSRTSMLYKKDGWARLEMRYCTHLHSMPNLMYKKYTGLHSTFCGAATIDPTLTTHWLPASRRRSLVRQLRMDRLSKKGSHV